MYGLKPRPVLTVPTLWFDMHLVPWVILIELDVLARVFDVMQALLSTVLPLFEL